MSEDVTEWLSSLGLDQYASTFEENAVEFVILFELTDTDLKELGIDALGHRKILMKSIYDLQSDRSTTASQAGNLESTKAKTQPASDEDITAWSRTPGERKPVTMLFADIVGSTSLTENLDAEEAHFLLYRATQQMCEAVEANQGTICRLMGDGIMAMFGAPVSSERHALEACHAALKMQTSISRKAKDPKQNHDSQIQIRVGIHSGEVVVLEVGDDPDKPEYDASGSTVALAARMEQSASAGTILMTESTRALAGNLVETVEHPAVTAKGISEPVAVHQLNHIHSASKALDITDRRPITGRKSELAQFRGLIEACLENGHGQTVLVRGEAGIGKTRLVEEMTLQAEEKGFDCHKSLVLDFGVGKGQEAVPSLVRSFLGIPQGSSKSYREGAVVRAEKEAVVHAGQRVYLNDLLDLTQPLELRTLYDAMDVSARIDGKHKTVADILKRLTSRQPVMLVVEGLHWADAETLGYLARLTRAVAECTALMVLTSRLEGNPINSGWRAQAGEHPSVTWDLGPLRMNQSLEFAANFIGRNDDLARRCVERAEGNPLFLEQLLLGIKKGSIETVPDSIKSLILARIDQLPGEDKLALRAASVLGQRFELEGLCYLIANPDYTCQGLVEHHLVRSEGSLYMFSHALIQGGIYASLLKSQRNELHSRAAQWFAKRDVVLQAEHLDRAGDNGAAHAYLCAARKQAELYRPERALQLVRRGLEIAPDLELFGLSCLEGELLQILGDTPESINAYCRAVEVAGGEIGRCNAWIGVAQGLAATGPQQELIEVLGNAEEIAREHRLLLELARIYQIRGSMLFYRGQIEACLKANEASLQYAQDAKSVEVEAQARSGLANAEYNRGRFISAHRHFDQCIELARKHGFGRVIAANLSMRGYVTFWQNDIKSSMSDIREAIDQAIKINDPRAEMLALIIGGSFWVSIANIVEGEKWLKRSLTITRRLGLPVFEGVCHYLLARVALQQGDRRQATKLAQKGVSILRESETGITFGGSIALGVLALAEESAENCHQYLKEAESVLDAGSVGHNYLNFYEDAMAACLRMEAWDEVDRYANALEDYTHAEPLPRSDFFIAYGRVLAAHGRGNREQATITELDHLYKEAQGIGLKLSLPVLQAALSDIA